MLSNQGLDFFIQLHLTERCNLRCKHCYQTGKGVDELSLPEVESAAKEIADTLSEWEDLYTLSYSPSFNITGGEPFLRSDLLDVIAAVKYRGFEVYLLTNGILIDKKKAQALSHLGVNGVQVSIEGPEKIHESIRGEGSFSASLKGVKNLLDAGVKVTLNVTLSSVNAGYFMDIIELAGGLGVDRVGFSRLVPSGRGKTMIKKMLDKGKVKELYKKIFSLDTGKIVIVTGDPVATQSTVKNDRKDKGDIPLGGCAAGVSGLTIMPDGSFVPCRRLPVPVGNIRRNSFREVWATSEVLGAIRDRAKYNGKCRTCKRWAHCRGCRAIAYAWSKACGENDFLAEDPQCFIDDSSS
jgi:radical SAM protein with 4Fe4S-binding SPASM domain